jgi:hypothetical protein
MNLTYNNINTSLLIISLFIGGCNSSQEPRAFGQKEKSANPANSINHIQPDTAKRPFKVVFKDVAEIRKGSPYNTCKIELSGTDKIKLPQAIWQDKFSWSNDSKNLVLIQWLGPGESPGFKFFIIDTENGKTTEGIKMAGAVNSLQIKGDTVTYNKFYYDKAKSKDTLCCSFQEDYILKLLGQ